MFCELKYEGWASRYDSGQAYAVFLRLWADGHPRQQVVATLRRDDANAIVLVVGEDELRAALIREAVRQTSKVGWRQSATGAVDLARSDVEAMVHSVPLLPTLRQDAVVGSFNR